MSAIGHNILLVEDDFYIHDLYQRQLVKEGYMVKVAESGRQAFEILESFVPDLVLLDLMLPDRSGFDVLKEVRAKEGAKHTVIILLTNLTQDEAIKEGFKLGADGYLIKSAYTPTQVVDEVKTYITVEKNEPAKA